MHANKIVKMHGYISIHMGIRVKYNKPDVFLSNKIKKKIIIVEIGIAGFNNIQQLKKKQI